MSETKELNVVILDNTVPDDTYREHKGLMWVLNNQKYVHETNEAYRYDKDYYGFFPQEDYKYEIKLMPSPLEDVDFIYIADAYGVYEKEFYGTNPEGLRSNMIYGGMKGGELDKIEAEVHAGTPLLVEFNTFGSPTDGSTKDRLYQLLEVEWTGWIGRFFYELTEHVEVPLWAVMNYEQQYGKEWEFQGPGFLLVNEKDEVLVLEMEIDIEKEGCRINFTDAGSQFFDISEKIRYNYWFNIVTPREKGEVLAYFSLELTEYGKEQLEARGIPSVFPAVVRNQNDIYFAYYFAGDFVDIGTIPGYYKLYGYDKLEKIISSDNKENDGFFWKIYVPMIKKILQQVYEKKIS
ncbi:MAG: hypothetical protein ACXQTP_04320 [Candidatus Methanofastidiosia archaeon]